MKVAPAIALLILLASSAEASTFGATIELAGIEKQEHGVIAPIPVIGLVRYGTLISTWAEYGTYEVPSTSRVVYWPDTYSWDRAGGPRLAISEPVEGTTRFRALCFGVLIRPPQTGVLPFFRCGVGFYSGNRIRDVPPLPTAAKSLAVMYRPDEISEIEPGATVGFGFQGDFGKSPVSPALEVRWQGTSLYDLRGSAILSVHAGLWFRRP